MTTAIQVGGPQGVALPQPRPWREFLAKAVSLVRHWLDCGAFGSFSMAPTDLRALPKPQPTTPSADLRLAWLTLIQRQELLPCARVDRIYGLFEAQNDRMRSLRETALYCDDHGYTARDRTVAWPGMKRLLTRKGENELQRLARADLDSVVYFGYLGPSGSNNCSP